MAAADWGSRDSSRRTARTSPREHEPALLRPATLLPVLDHESDAVSCDGGSNDKFDIVERQLTLDLDIQLAPVLLELPSVDAPAHHAEIDAGVPGQIMRRQRLPCCAK